METDRYGALTYSSFDDGAGPGGWQVKERLALSSEDEAALLAGLATDLPTDALSRFPTPEEIRALPRRLTYLPVGTGVAWSHTIPAGHDASGRPGNVFAQIVLDRVPASGSRTRRPIDVWRANEWLTPYGADAVRETRLTRVEPPTPGVLDRDTVLDFLLDLRHYRLGTYGALLDACSAAMLGQGPPVVIGCANGESAACWIAAVTSCMLTQHAQGFFFSTLERPQSVDSLIARGAHLVAVPSALLEPLSDRNDLVVIDETDQIEIGDVWGTPHRTSRGRQIPAGDWSGMAQVAFLDHATADQTMNRVDELSVASDLVGYEPAWGLAAVVCDHPELLGDAATEAARVIVRATPGDLTVQEGRYAALRSLINSQAGTSAAEAWSLIDQRHRLTGPGSVDRILTAIYCRRALADPVWLSRPGGVSLPPQRNLPEDAVVDVRDALTLGQAGIRSMEEPGQSAAAAIGALSLATAVGLLDPRHPECDSLADLIDAVVTPRLLGPDAEALVERVGPLGEPALAAVIRPSLDGSEPMHRGVPGRRLSARLVSWLYPQGAAPVSLRLDTEPDVSPVRLELAIRRVLDGGVDQQLERPFAALGVLAHRRTDPDIEAPEPLPEWVADPVGWVAADVAVLEQRFPAALGPAWLAPTLVSSNADPGLTELCATLTTRVEPAPVSDDAYDVIAIATARLVELHSWYSHDKPDRDLAIGQLLAGGAAAARLTAVPFATSWRPHLMTAVVLAIVERMDRLNAASVRDRLATTAGQLSEREESMIANGLHSTDLAKVALRAMSTDQRSPLYSVAGQAASLWVSERLSPHARHVPVLTHYVQQMIERETAEPQQLAARVARLAVPEADDGDRTERRFRRFAESWLRDLPGQLDLRDNRGGRPR